MPAKKPTPAKKPAPTPAKKPVVATTVPVPPVPPVPAPVVATTVPVPVPVPVPPVPAPVVATPVPAPVVATPVVATPVPPAPTKITVELEEHYNTISVNVTGMSRREAENALAEECGAYAIVHGENSSTGRCYTADSDAKIGEPGTVESSLSLGGQKVDRFYKKYHGSDV